jgi:hypothetical protein
MDITPATLTDEPVLPHARVRVDLAAGTVLLAVVIGGNLLREASDAGILSAFGTH